MCLSCFANTSVSHSLSPLCCRDSTGWLTRCQLTNANKNVEMKSFCGASAPKCWVSSAVCLGLLASFLLFMHGFMTTRIELPDRSCALGPGNTLDGQNECNAPATFNKAVVMVIDAMRSDFFFTSTPGAPAAVQRMPRLHQLVAEAVGVPYINLPLKPSNLRHINHPIKCKG